MSKYKIIYLVNSLGNGGSEKQLFYLIRSLHIKFEISIIKTNNNIEYYDHKIKELGIEIYSYDISNSLFSVGQIKFKSIFRFIISEIFLTKSNALG